jgi:hydroxyethylthiazole kinase-like uncharacterized protein yjeF
MKVLLPEDMRRVEREAMDALHLTEEILMERAGMAVARVLLGTYLGVSKVTALAGKGNNGGDALTALRELHCRGIHVSGVLQYPLSECRPSVVREAARLERLGIEVVSVSDSKAWHRIRHSDVVIDGLLGTGFQGTPKIELKETIERLNALRYKVVSVDIPSGVDGETGKVQGIAVRATTTVTLGFPKWGLLVDPGIDMAGTIVVSDIGIPPEFCSGGLLCAFDDQDAKKCLPRRELSIHKGKSGHVAVWGGSPGKRGAPELVALGALRAGSGLATVFYGDGDKGVLPRFPEIMVDGWTRDRSESLPLDLLDRMDVLAVGPGLDPQPAFRKTLDEILAGFSGPIVGDAGFFDLFQKKPDGVRRKSGLPLVLTPHPGEFSRFVGLPVREVIENGLSLAKEISVKSGAVVLLKGWKTIVAAPDGRSAVNLSGAPNMATAGMGDVLTGIISGFLGQGVEPFLAAALGAYVHGRAGEETYRSGITRGLLAHELADSVPGILSGLENRAFPSHDVDRTLYVPLDAVFTDRPGPYA